MQEEIVLENVPKRLQKDIVATRHEVPVSGGGSGTEVDYFYSPRLIRWAVESWLQSVPGEPNARVLQRTLLAVLADPRTFRAYLRVPDAFLDTYREELGKLNERRVDLAEMKNLLLHRNGRFWTPARALGTILGFVASLVIVGSMM